MGQAKDGKSTAWNSTNFKGVRYRKHATRKHGVKFDQYFSIRFQVDGKPIEQGVGWASEGMSAAKAYDLLNELKEAAKTGSAPATLKERRRQNALVEDQNPCFATAVDDFLKYCERKKLRPKTLLCYRDSLARAKEFVPAKGTGKLENWKLKEINRRHLASLVESISSKSPSVAIQVRSSLSALYSWAVQPPREYVETNIVRDTPRPPKPKPRERYLTGSEAGALWQKLQAAEGDSSMIRCLQFALLVGCRISEASGMAANEVDDDWWTIPAERNKGKRAHRVFLTETAKALIGEKKGMIFPSERTRRQFDTASFAAWLRKNKHFDLEKFSCHDFRRTLASGLASLKVSQDVVAAVLGHKLQGVTAEHYIRHKYDDEKQTALKCWEAYLLKCAQPEKRQADVIPLISA